MARSEMPDADVSSELSRTPPPVIDVAIFACFNPPPDVLDRIRTVADSVRTVVVVDDGSSDIDDDFYRPLAALKNVSVVCKSENRGIAHSLNLGFNSALAGGARMVVTFDQDTDVTIGLLDSLGAAAAELQDRIPGRWGAVGPGIVNGYRNWATAPGEDFNRACRPRPVYELIQSAAVFNAGALRECGLADESLIIDSVDTDMCLRLRAGGFGAYVDWQIELSHPLGDREVMNALGRRLGLRSHSGRRRYYMTRNRLVMFKRYGFADRRWLSKAVVWFAMSVALSLTVEDNRLETLRATSHGVRDFLRGRNGPAPAAIGR